MQSPLETMLREKNAHTGVIHRFASNANGKNQTPHSVASDHDNPDLPHVRRGYPDRVALSQVLGSSFAGLEFGYF